MPDFVLDYISVNTFWTILFIVHALLAVALLGALTHQAMSVLMPVRAGGGRRPSFVTRFRAVHGPGYAAAVCVLWIVTFIFGAWIYTKYRMYVRIPIEQAGFWKTQGVFELKEHLAVDRARAAADLLVLLEERARSGIRQRAQMADRHARGDVLVHVPGRPHRQQRAGVRIMSTTTQTPARRSARRLAGLLGDVPHLRDGVRDRDADHLHDLRDAELAAVHLSSRAPTGSISAGRRRCSDQGPAMYWYGWTATTLIGAARARPARHAAAGKHDQENPAVAGLDHCRSPRFRS